MNTEKNLTNTGTYPSEITQTVKERAVMLARAFKRARTSLGLDQTEMAKRIGCSPSLLYRLEQERGWLSQHSDGRPTNVTSMASISTVRAAATAYGLDVDYISSMAAQQRRDFGLEESRNSAFGWSKAGAYRKRAAKSVTVEKIPSQQLRPELNGFHGAGFSKEKDEVIAKLTHALDELGAHIDEIGIRANIAVAFAVLAVILTLAF